MIFNDFSEPKYCAGYTLCTECGQELAVEFNYSVIIRGNFPLNLFEYDKISIYVWRIEICKWFKLFQVHVNLETENKDIYFIKKVFPAQNEIFNS